MKRIKVSTAIILTAILIMSVVGCADKNESSSSAFSDKKDIVDGDVGKDLLPLTEISLPIVNEPVTLSYWAPMSKPDLYQSWNDTLSMQELERKTGVHIEFIHPTIGQDAEAYSLMMASQDLPDIIQEREGSVYYPGGADKAISDGVYRELTPLIDQYAPNYKKWLESSETISSMTATDEGNRWGMFQLSEEAEPAWTGYSIRQDWLDELNMEIPVTLDDWYTVLTAFKNELNVRAPLLIYNTGTPLYNQIISAFGIGNSFYQKEGKVAYGPSQPEYFEYLTLMNQWYKEGLIDQDFMGRTDAGFQYFAPAYLAATGKAGIFQTVWGFAADSYVSTGEAEDPDFYLTAISAPRKTKDQTIHFNYPSYQVRIGTAVSTSCQNPEIAVQWMDYQYSQEGSNIISYGIEGDTFVLDDDGKPVFTEKILNPQDKNLTADLAYQKYCRWDGVGLLDFKRMWQISIASGMGAQLDALGIWAKDDIEYVIPPLSMTSEEGDNYNDIMPDVQTYVNEMTVRFITGIEPLDKFDSYIDQLRKMNIQRAIDIQQTSLDRFNKR